MRSLSIPVCALVCASAHAASIDFESDDAKYTLHQGELTSQRSERISARRSLLGDSRGKETEWFEFFTSSPGLVTKGYEYTVTFRYRPVRAAAKAKLYGLFRSKSKGWGQWDRGWTSFDNLAASVGTVKTATMTVGLDIHGDYQLMLGINGDARVAIDDIRIVRGKPYREPTPEEKILKTIPETAEVHFGADFEGGAGATVELTRNASVTSTGEGVIRGSSSLLVDSTRSSSDWNEAAKTRRGSFPKGYVYHVFFRYKGLATNPGAYAYFILRSARHGAGGKDLGWKQWPVEPGKTEVSYRRVEVTELDDYQLIFGTHKRAKLSIDDLVVRREPLAKKHIATRTPFVRTDANLVFADEFEGATIDRTVWKLEGDVKRRGAYWMKEDSFLDGMGSYIMRFRKRPDGKYSGGAMRTRCEFKHGYFEARMKMPKQEGHWPGFWLFCGGVNSVGDEGRDGTEVDIMEAPWRHKDEVTQTLHWDGYGPEHASKGQHATVPNLHDGWHTFAVEWSKDGYIFYVDDRETWRTDAGGVCEKPLHIILSDEVGGWSGNPDRAALPDHTYVDYVRVWQERKSIVEPVD